jgi:hypothetical protein
VGRREKIENKNKYRIRRVIEIRFRSRESRSRGVEEIVEEKEC